MSKPPMQPDPTPDMDEIERLMVNGALSRCADAVESNSSSDNELQDADDARRIRNALPWLLRAARERDELRAMYEQAVSPSASCASERAAGNGGCGACVICCNELRAKVERLVSRGIEDLRFENDELRVEVEAWREKPWADQLRAQSARISQLMARAEKAEADLAESRRLVEKAEARAKELEAGLRATLAKPCHCVPGDGHRNCHIAVSRAFLAHKEPKP